MGIDKLYKDLPPVEQAEKFFPGLRHGSHATQHAACGGRGSRLLYPSHNHTKVARFHHYCNTSGFQDFGYSQCNLLRKTFLNLKASRKHFGEPCELG